MGPRFGSSDVIWLYLLTFYCTHYFCYYCTHYIHYAAIPDPEVTDFTFIPSAKPRDNDPPELIFSFNVSIAPPTYVTCQVDGTPVDVADLSREVTSALYLLPNTASPVTSVTVTLRTRQAGNYQCTVSVFRASMESSTKNLTNARTSLINISGKITMIYDVNKCWSIIKIN